jgi:trk system potassium uptake protein TrkA
MYIIIAGGGIVGSTIAKALAKQHDVVIIDKDLARCEELTAKLGIVAIHGDATNIATLREAGIERAHYGLAVMRYDNQNLLFSLLAKQFKVEEIYVRMRDPDYRDAYYMAGATNIGHSVQMIANKFILDIEQPEIRSVASLRNGKAEVAIITFPVKAANADKTISEIARQKGFPEDVVIAGVFDQESDRLIIPRGDTVLHPGNQVFLVGTSESIRKAFKFLAKK